MQLWPHVGLWLIVTMIAGQVLSCSCNYGNVDIATPQCVCACYPDYLQPHCLYTADDMTPMGIWINISSSQFLSSDWTQTLTWGLGIQSSDDIVFLRAKKGPTNATYAVFSLRGSYAQQLLWDVYSSSNWTASVKIVSAWEEAMPASTGAGETDTSMVVYQSTDKKTVITINGLAWLISATVGTIVVVGFEYLTSQNKEEVVAELHEQNEEYYERVRTDALRRQVGHGGYDDDFKSAGPSHHQHHNIRNPLEHDMEVQSYTHISSDDDRG